MKLRDECRSVLEGFFSVPIAKAIIGAASKAALRAGVEDSMHWQDAFEAELERLLSVYLPERERFRACAAKLLERRTALAIPAPPATPPLSSADYPARPVSGAYERPGLVRRVSETRVAVPPSVGTASTSVVIRDQTDIPNACEVARDLGRKLGFSRVDQTKMATAVSELARNMLQYAGGGTIRFAEVLSPRRGLEAFFEDHGPGIVGLDDMLEAGSMGLGLRGSRGIADEFTIDTQPGDGTRITMRKYVA